MEGDYLTVLGYLLAVTGSLAWIPQIVKILQSRSGAGLNLTVYTVVDLITSLISAFCIKSGLHPSNFAEVLITNLQIFLIHALARFYLGQRTQLLGLFGLKALYILLLVLTPLGWIKLAMNCLLPVMVFNRGGEVYRHYKHKSTGQLAGGTLLLQWVQFSGRIFTSYVGGVMEPGFLVPMVTNLIFTTIIGLQFIIYSSKDEKKRE